MEVVETDPKILHSFFGKMKRLQSNRSESFPYPNPPKPDTPTVSVKYFIKNVLV